MAIQFEFGDSMPSVTSSRSRLFWLALIVVALIGAAAFFVPAYILRPFARQTQSGLLWAMAIRQRAPLVSLICALACWALAVGKWRASSRWGKVLLVVPLFFVTFSAVMSRLNYFEWMFHPVPEAHFEAAGASKLDGKEMILAVRYGADARAYPIREMAYHHVLNDVVSGVPIAVTY